MTHRTLRAAVRAILVAALAGALAAASPAASSPQRGDQADVLLQAARNKQVVEGKLDEAITLYQQIVAQHGGNRPVAARAKLEMAQCYEKLGASQNAEARKLYESVIRDYADQTTTVADARARLAALAPAAAGQGRAMSSRVVWTAPEGMDPWAVSSDGRLLAYLGWSRNEGGNIFIHDFVTGADRQVTAARAGQSAEGPIFSKDSTQFAYVWYDTEASGGEVRVASLAGTGIPEGRRVKVDGEIDRMWTGCWTPDGSRLALWLRRKDGTRVVGFVTVGGGPIQPIKLAGTDVGGVSAVSPDGRYAAVGVSQPTSRGRDIVIVAIADGREVSRIVHPGDDEAVGWSPDGRRLIFTSDRSGSVGLWTQPFADGRLAGVPEAISAKLGSPALVLGVAASGAVYSSSLNRSRESEVRTAALDVTVGAWATPPTNPLRSLNLPWEDLPSEIDPSPAWSPDGKRLAVVVGRDRQSQASLRGMILVTSPDSRASTVVRPGLSRLTGSILWTPDGSAFLASGASADGREGLWRIDASSGDTAEFELEPETSPTWKQLLAFSRDGKYLRFTRRAGGVENAVVVQKDLATGRERELVKRLDFADVADDGSKLYYCRRGADNGTQRFKTSAVVERDLATGQEREIFKGDIAGTTLSPDGRFIGTVSGTGTAASQSQAIVFVPVDGSPTRERMTATFTMPAEGDADSRGSRPGLAQFTWSLDSKALIVRNCSGGSAQCELWWVPVIGEPRKLDVGGSGEVNNISWHPDGRQIALTVRQKLPPKPVEVWLHENALPVKK